MLKNICFGIVLVFGYMSTAYAEVKISACHGNGGYPPYHFTNPQEPRNPEMIGVSIDLAKAIFAKLSIDLEIKALPWKRCFNSAKEGRGFDMIIDGSFKADRQAFFAYTSKMHVLNPAVAVRQDSKWAQSEMLKATDLKDAIICSNRGTNLVPYGFTNDQISTRASGVKQGLYMVDSKRCDGYLTLYQVFNGHYRYGNEDVLPDSLVIRKFETDKTFDLHFMVSKTRSDADELATKINKVLAEIHKDGSLDLLWNSYLN
ncbi:substrate-binding periplasmic protein [Curvivirga aplysinae]|uniref:substrate-binding periplasmic protein n=1 Tax=Curvivirga aplysinae TaxID=2529852 RepID=UPI0012BBEC74|nr:transporter substrate-binding domain-containing protein [Curvivirga aplysinae]MTI08811.1 transporter substrate-binding domain-containing protein [Curvivirga aplysinae]